MEGLPAAPWATWVSVGSVRGTRRRGKRLGRRPDGRRAARRPCHPQKTFVERLLEPGLAASIGARELKMAAIEANPTSSRRGRPPDGLQREMAQICTILLLGGEAAALLRVSGRTVIHAARVLSEDSPAALAGRLAVEQGRITVSDASRVMDEPAEVQLRALERVTGGGSRNLAGAAQGAAPGGGLRRWPRLSAVLGRPHGGSGERRHDGPHQPARTWGEVRRWWWQVRTPALVTLGVGWGPSQGWISSSPRATAAGEKRGPGRTVPRSPP